MKPVKFLKQCVENAKMLENVQNTTHVHCITIIRDIWTYCKFFVLSEWYIPKPICPWLKEDDSIKWRFWILYYLILAFTFFFVQLWSYNSENFLFLNFWQNCRKLQFISLYPLYRGADKSLAQPGRKQANVSVRIAWISFGALPYRKKNLMTSCISMLLKSRASLTRFRSCFLSGQAKDLSAPRYVKLDGKSQLLYNLYPFLVPIKFRNS